MSIRLEDLSKHKTKQVEISVGDILKNDEFSEEEKIRLLYKYHWKVWNQTAIAKKFELTKKEVKEIIINESIKNNGSESKNNT